MESVACPFLDKFANGHHDGGSLDKISPSLSGEYKKILQSNIVLAPTGCTAEFCQAGRMIHSDEPRVGENRPLDIIKKEADAFLWQLWQEGVYTEGQYRQRYEEVNNSLEASAVYETVCINGSKTVIRTAVWTQTSEELLHGLRLSWKNSRKCIMRSHYRELELCDLRHIKTSKGMVTSVIDEAIKAFNNGHIKPTVFAFPPRSTTGTGPMFWSKQLLNFAGYQLDDGSVLGDPSNVDITKDIMDLGWVPPSPKSRWDLLPVVAMAENDAPAIAELPDELRNLISIEHPSYPAQFQNLDLKWYQFPALCRLGFDIGGVQYTAAPFIGWYMDAEVGVRNLADSFRYNSLTNVAEAIGFNIDSYRKRIEYSGIESLDDLPDYEQLVWLSRAQAELNYAVRWSFLQKGISCVGTLAASNDWCQFDDEHASKYGYRLNADPYWIAPPQGSIIPLWHRGGAPNYQPKPLIARHRFDPIKSWKRQQNKIQAAPSYFMKHGTEWICVNIKLTMFPSGLPNAIMNKVDGVAESLLVRNKIHICYCSNGTTALKLAEKLHRRVKQILGCRQVVFSTLNSLDFQKIGTSDIVLMVISTTGHGCFPANGTNLEESMDKIRQRYSEITLPVHFSIYGVGDSAYPTFNAAAIKLNQFWMDLQAIPIGNGLVKGDVAVEALPLSSFNRWWDTIECFLTGKSQMVENNEEEFAGHSQMIRAFKDATLLECPQITGDERIVTVLMDIGNTTYEEMSHLRLLPQNSYSKVARALSAFGIRDAKALVPFKDSRLQHWNYDDFFTRFVDLEGQFRSLDWTSKVSTTQEKDRAESVLETLERHGSLRLLEPSNGLHLEICLNMPLLRPRSFSVASSGRYLGHGKVELLIKTHKQGRISNIFLSELDLRAQMKYAPISKIPGQDLLDLVDKPLIVISTGTGFAPIRSLLQKRIYISKDAEEKGKPHPFSGSPISLFAGFKAHDQDSFSQIVLTAKHYNLLDIFFLVPSNEQKKRVQDYVEKSKWKLLPKLDEGYVYVCGNAAMVKATAAKLSDWVMGDVNLVLGKRYVEEIF